MVKDKLLAIDWKELWRYRDMFVLFVQRNFRVAYKQTILGPLWFIITPVLSVIVYATVFGGIANLKYRVKDLRLFSENDVRFLRQFESC